MPTGRAVRAGIIALALLLAGCAGGVVGGPSESSTPSVTASTLARPPLADDLTDGTPLRLGSPGHWAIGAGHAFVAASDGTVSAIDLTTGATTWRSSFRQGKPWDAQPTLGLSANQSTVVAVRTVDSGGTPRLDLLVLDAATGATAAEHLVEDPARAWRVDLPPRVLAADADTVVLADDPARTPGQQQRKGDDARADGPAGRHVLTLVQNHLRHPRNADPSARLTT